MTASTGAPTACPRCGWAGRPNHVAFHAARCLTPRTVERLAEIGRAVRLDGCLLWRGEADRAGFHQTERVYVIACELTHGPRPLGQEVLHSCDRPGCFEPAHLRWGTHAENMRDMGDRDRHGGAVRWSYAERIAAGLDGSAARAARWLS